jgi:hypothetical protein
MSTSMRQNDVTDNEALELLVVNYRAARPAPRR